MEAAVALELKHMNCYAVANIDKINIYDFKTFKKVDAIDVKLLAYDSREPN